MSRLAGWLLALAALPAAAPSRDIVIYRCSDAQGAISVQNQPCPRGQHQQRRSMQVPSDPPPSVQPVPVPPLPQGSAGIPGQVTAGNPAQEGKSAAPAQAAVTDGDAGMVAPPSPKPPPPLYECRRRDDTRYLVEDLARATYCVPLQAIGLDGNPAKGAGEACEVLSDRCAAVPEAELCQAWDRRREEAESRWRFAPPGDSAGLQRDYAEVAARVAGSRCDNGNGNGNSDGNNAQKP